MESSDEDNSDNDTVIIDTTGAARPITNAAPHRRSSSVQSPPLAPPDFNPPADAPIDPVTTVSPPLSASSSWTGSFISEQLAQAEFTRRPSAFQRMSYESTPESQSSVESSGQEHQEHLAEMRDRLISTGSRSRQGSESGPSGGVEYQAMELRIISPTPPLRPADDVSEAGPSRLRDYDMEEQPAEQSWDSVWPAPGKILRQDLGPSQFAMAPVSPFVTPAFSPAVIAQNMFTRRPPSPTFHPRDLNRHSNSPAPGLRISPRRSPDLDQRNSEYFPLTRRRSITSPSSPLLGTITASPVAISSRHQRSQSNSSPSFSQRGNQGSPTESPQGSPKRRASRLSGSRNERPDQRLLRQGDPLEMGSSPPSGFSFGRPRGMSGSGSRPPPPPAEPDLEPMRRYLGKRGSDPTPFSPESPASASPLSPTDPNSLPPILLPPAVTTAPVLSRKSSTQEPADLVSSASPPSLLFAPSARPTALRRALSDYDARHRPTAPSLNRTLSITAELDKSPKRPTGLSDLQSPDSPTSGDRVRKSPRMLISNEAVAEDSVQEVDIYPRDSDVEGLRLDTPSIGSQDSYAGDVGLVDEGDVLPQPSDYGVDVTFDDEGLNTLERIFLLSKSEYAFHRAYVARVLGDLLKDVDPCESVEYVLPLLSGFSMDEDDSVKEAFASELHRILWYFYSTCRFVEEEDVAQAGEELEAEAGPSAAPQKTVTITSEGVNVVPKPTPAELAAAPVVSLRRTSVISLNGPSTAGSNSTKASSSAFDSIIDEGSTPTSMTSETPSDTGTAFSPGVFINPYADDMDPKKGWAKSAGPLVDRPTLTVGFFTPLLGSLLLNASPTISESVRAGVVHIISRLRGQSNLDMETWGQGASQPEPDERRVFAGQNGPHSHDLRPFDQAARKFVENQLLQDIIIGMGGLSTDMPDTLFEEGEEAEMFHQQLVAEATAGRATSMNLIGSIAEFYSGEEAIEAGFLDEVLRSGDGDVAVRAEGAVAMSTMAKIAPVEHIYDMIPLFEAFVDDETDHVRQSACLSLPALCRRIESPDYRRAFAVRNALALVESGDEVRCAVLEIMGEIIHIFLDDSRGPPKELLEVYLDDSNIWANDSDWDVVASFNFPGICLTLGPDRWPELLPLYQRLQSRAGDKVTRTLAASLHELSKILHPSSVEKDLLPVYKRCLQSNDEIRERVFEHVDVFVSRVPRSLGWKLFLELAQAWKENNLGGWRAREQLALHIPSFFATFREEELERVLEMTRDALLDPFACVRDAATHGIPRSYTVLPDGSKIAEGFRNTLLELSTSSKYRQRLTFVRCLREFVKPPPNRDAFEEFFIPILPKLSEDVVDVRLALAQIIASLFIVGAFYGAKEAPIPPSIMDLAKQLAQDQAVDVRDTVRLVDLDRLSKGKDIPHRVEPNHPPDRSYDPTASPSRSSSIPQPSRPSNNGQPDSNDSNTSHSTAKPQPENVRRPSQDVLRRIGGMNLSPDGDSDDTSTPQFDVASWLSDSSPTNTGPGRNGSASDVRRLSTDPFEESFAEALPD